jgi:hypothetical protein
MNSATTGLGAGENASKNKVAGRSQKLIAAASIRTVPHWQCATGTEAACRIDGAGHPGAYGAGVYIAKSRHRAFPPGFFLENMRNRVRLATRAVISMQ